jgi:hypothetical protein
MFSYINNIIKYLIFIGLIYLTLKYIPNSPLNNKDILLLVTIIFICLVIYDILLNYISNINLCPNNSYENFTFNNLIENLYSPEKTIDGYKRKNMNLIKDDTKYPYTEEIAENDDSNICANKCSLNDTCYGFTYNPINKVCKLYKTSMTGNDLPRLQTCNNRNPSKCKTREGQYGETWEKILPPTTQTTQPSNQTTQPSNQTTQPYNQTTQPSNQTTQPYNQTTQPYNQTTQPYNQTTQPSNQTTQPYNQTTQPSNQTTQPYNQTTQPSNQTTQPYRQTTQPYNQTTQPSNQTTQPYNQTTQPYNQTTQPYRQTSPSNQHILSNYDHIKDNDRNYDNKWNNYHRTKDRDRHLDNNLGNLDNNLGNLDNNLGNLDNNLGNLGNILDKNTIGNLISNLGNSLDKDTIGNLISNLGNSLDKDTIGNLISNLGNILDKDTISNLIGNLGNVLNKNNNNLANGIVYDNNVGKSNCENEINKLKMQLDALTSNNNNNTNTYSTIASNYLNKLITSLLNKKIITQIDVNNIKVKLNSKLFSLSDVINSLEILDANTNDSNKKDYNIKNELPTDFYSPIGDKVSNNWSKDYSILDTSKWTVPMPRPPVCINSQPCKVCPSSETIGMNLLEWDKKQIN